MKLKHIKWSYLFKQILKKLYTNQSKLLYQKHIMEQTILYIYILKYNIKF